MIKETEVLQEPLPHNFSIIRMEINKSYRHDAHRE